MLTGDALIKFIDSNAELTQAELAREAGYTSTDKDGKTRLLRNSFTNAVLEAKGVKFKKGKSLVGKSATYETTVHKSGVILVGKTYSQELGLEPGEPLTIQLEKDGSLRLVPVA